MPRRGPLEKQLNAGKLEFSATVAFGVPSFGLSPIMTFEIYEAKNAYYLGQ